MDLQSFLSPTLPHTFLPHLLILLGAYPILVSLLRFRRLQWMEKKYNYPTRESLSRMTVNEAWEIQKVLASLEFPSTFVKSLKFSLFRVSLIYCRHSVRLLTSYISFSGLWYPHDFRTTF